jgi:thymidine kinase
VTRQYDREYSSPFMLPVETERIKNLSDELQFFTEQLWREIRRIVDDNVQF